VFQVGEAFEITPFYGTSVLPINLNQNLRSKDYLKFDETERNENKTCYQYSTKSLKVTNLEPVFLVHSDP